MPVQANDEWLDTRLGERRGYIQPHTLSELWFHTGTACNLACPFCLEGSKPGDGRLGHVTLGDVRPFVDEAVELGVRQFSFTGGEPFVNRDIVRILAYTLDRARCLVLSNGVDALTQRLEQIEPLRASAHSLAFRISIDHSDEALHDAGRGAGNFAKAWTALRELHARGFKVSIARQMAPNEDGAGVEAAYRDLLRRHGVPEDLTLVAFPDFGAPGAQRDVPDVTESCMTRFQTEATRREFMCAYSKMVVKQGGRMRVYACTLVDDDPAYDQGATLRESLGMRVRLKHPRCYSCFRYGASCSETRGH